MPSSMFFSFLSKRDILRIVNCGSCVSFLIRWKSLGLSNTIWCLVVVFKLVLDGCYLTLALGMLLGSIETRLVNVLLYS
jgi:hypothetical protein